MSEETNTPAKRSETPSRAASADPDLSTEIMAAVDTPAGETVRCVRVFGDNYRCNWWGNEELSGKGKPTESSFQATEQRVRRSRLLKVRKTAAGLQIQDVTAQ